MRKVLFLILLCLLLAPLNSLASSPVAHSDLSWSIDSTTLTYFEIPDPTPAISWTVEDGNILITYTTAEEWSYTFRVVLELPPDGKLPPSPVLRLEFIKLEKED